MWSYFRSSQIEIGVPDTVLRRPLQPHVHASVQVMVVTEGARRVQLGGQSVLMPARSVLIVPPGVAHVAQPSGWTGFNAYLDPAAGLAMPARLLRLSRLPRWTRDIGDRGTSCDIPALLALIAEGTVIWSDPQLLPFRPDRADLAHWPQSREGHIRRYRREAGIAPHAHFKAMRLDQARHRLAQGEAIASVAAELGFTDQSHLGRQFRAAFGTTPGRYAKGVTNMPDGGPCSA